jgi:uncharacterized 2Fe-2S/4Fe-4S cluster protein (DUF4445 family)
LASIILPTERITVQVRPGETLASALSRAGVRLYAPCAGRGICGKCRVVVKPGPGISPPAGIELVHLSDDELSSGVRLACQATISGEADVTVLSRVAPHEESASILTEGRAPSNRVVLDDARARVQTAFVDPESPATSDWDRISLAFGLPQGGSEHDGSGWPPGRLEPAAAPGIQLARAVGEAMAKATDLSTAQTRVQPCESASKSPTSNISRAANGVALTGVLIDGELSDVFHGGVRPARDGKGGGWSPLGIALDVGTTTVVGYLADLMTGRVLGARGAANPQAAHGADLISRIAYSESGDGLETLRLEIIKAVNELGSELLTEAGASPDDVYLVGAVGNTCMHHLFCGIAPSRLARIPYAPAVLESAPCSPAEAGLTCANPRGKFFFLPNIAGFVGSDALAVALVAGMNEHSAPTLAIDIGTNGEILLAANGRILACSTAAGPAFEGVNISCGMIAAPGAIESVRMGEDDIDCRTIGDASPAGICGSGLISLVAVLREASVISETGAFDPDRVDPASPLGSRLVEGRDGLEFVLAEPVPPSPRVVLTQRDVRELQLAKAAIRAGVEILLAESGIKADELSQIVLAGAFGTYLDTHAATAIGLFPDAGDARLVSLGNAAGQGVIMALASARAYQEARRLADVVEHVELGASPMFMEAFTESMFFVRG